MPRHAAGSLNLTHDERPELGGAFFTLRSETGDAIAIVLDPYETEDGDTAAAEEANAERLRDCWNMCAKGGVAVEALQYILDCADRNDFSDLQPVRDAMERLKGEVHKDRLAGG